jgi:hypothetical protein
MDSRRCSTTIQDVPRIAARQNFLAPFKDGRDFVGAQTR